MNICKYEFDHALQVFEQQHLAFQKHVKQLTQELIKLCKLHKLWRECVNNRDAPKTSISSMVDDQLLWLGNLLDVPVKTWDIDTNLLNLLAGLIKTSEQEQNQVFACHLQHLEQGSQLLGAQMASFAGKLYSGTSDLTF